MMQLIIDACGPEYARRFFLRDGSNYWNDIAGTWSADKKECHVVRRCCRNQQQAAGIDAPDPRRRANFVAPLFVEVKDSERVDLESLKAWLAQAVQVWVDAQFGAGPGDSMLMLNIDWDQLVRREDIDREREPLKPG